MDSIARLRPDSIEFGHWTVSNVPADIGDVAVSFDGGITWEPATWDPDLEEVVILIAPDTAESPDPSAVILASGIYQPLLRFSDLPESVVRSGGMFQIL